MAAQNVKGPAKYARTGQGAGLKRALADLICVQESSSGAQHMKDGSQMDDSVLDVEEEENHQMTTLVKRMYIIIVSDQILVHQMWCHMIFTI